MSVGTTRTYHCQPYHIQHGSPDNGRYCPMALAITAQSDGVAVIGQDGVVEIREVDWMYVDKATGKTRRRFKFGVDRVLRTGRLDATGLAWLTQFDLTGTGAPTDFLVTFR